MAVIVFAILLIMIYGTNNALSQQVLQPMDITRMEGAESVIIPCPVYTGVPPIWNINGNYYNINNLPRVYRPALIGIVIPTIYRSMNRTSFQCFYSVGNGIQVQQSSIGILSVVPRNNEAISLIVIGQDECLYLDHSNTYFGDSYITIGIKTEQSTSDCNMFSLIARNECEQESPIRETWRFNDDNTIKINSTFETNNDRLTFFDVIGKYNESTVCRRGQAAFQIYPNAITEELHVPILRSEEIKFSSPLHKPLHVILPTGNNVTVEKDCICSLVFLQSTPVSCTNLNNCSCLGNTTFTSSMIEICETGSVEVAIVFKNLSPSTNNTQIFFLAYDQCEESQFEYYYWEYVKSYEIKQVLPELPRVAVFEESEQICIYSPLEGGIPADEYRISVYDTTGGITFNTTLNLDDANCTLVEPSFQVLECAPFTIAVQAVNVAGHSKVNETIKVNDGRSDTCSCINNRVIVNMNSIEGVETIWVNFKCHKVNYKSDMMFLIGIDNLTTISCNDEKLFKNLSCRESYNVSAYWKSSLNSSLPVCLLDELIALTPRCPPSTEPERQTDGKSVAIIVSVTVIIITLIIAAIFVVCIVFKIRIQKRKKDYETCK